MGRAFYVSGFRDGDKFSGPKDRWVDDEILMRKRGRVRDGALDAPVDGQFHRDSALGFDSDQVHYAGDRVVTLGEVPRGDGDIDYYFERIGDDGRSLGTYVQVWRKEKEGRHMAAGKAKRTFSF